VLIIGDSHSRALLDGAAALGVKAFGVTVSGNVWHSGLVVAHRRLGMMVRRVRKPNEQLEELRAITGIQDVTKSGVPVLGSFGYHLGRLVPPLSWGGHRADDAELAQVDDGLFLSDAFVRDYIRAARAPVFGLLGSFAKAGSITVVAPPVPFNQPNNATARNIITEEIRALNIPVIDPMVSLAADDGTLRSDMLAEDGRHGNTEYGRLVVQTFLDQIHSNSSQD